MSDVNERKPEERHIKAQTQGITEVGYILPNTPDESKRPKVTFSDLKLDNPKDSTDTNSQHYTPSTSRTPSIQKKPRGILRGISSHDSMSSQDSKASRDSMDQSRIQDSTRHHSSSSDEDTGRTAQHGKQGSGSYREQYPLDYETSILSRTMSIQSDKESVPKSVVVSYMDMMPLDYAIMEFAAKNRSKTSSVSGSEVQISSDSIAKSEKFSAVEVAKRRQKSGKAVDSPPEGSFRSVVSHVSKTEAELEQMKALTIQMQGQMRLLMEQNARLERQLEGSPPTPSKNLNQAPTRGHSPIPLDFNYLGSFPTEEAVQRSLDATKPHSGSVAVESPTPKVANRSERSRHSNPNTQTEHEILVSQLQSGDDKQSQKSPNRFSLFKIFHKKEK